MSQAVSPVIVRCGFSFIGVYNTPKAYRAKDLRMVVKSKDIDLNSDLVHIEKLPAASEARWVSRKRS